MPIFALVDCNNFYASCERVFAPHLQNKPVAVLSNNDGCVIARSNEAKALGVKMGEPAFKREAFFKHHGVAIFSSNYALYGDLSARVMQTLTRFSPDIEIYSIDEAFLELSGFTRMDLRDYCLKICATVKQWTGIPISIGVGPTKTLAKVASRFAKKHAHCHGVYRVPQPTGGTPRQPHIHENEHLLEQIDVQDVWGVGRRYARMLRTHGVENARQLRDQDDHWVRKKMTVAGLHTVLELRGLSCIPMEQAPPPKKAIVTSRSFGRPQTTLAGLQEAVAAYMTRCAEKLRRQNSVASHLTVFIMTNPHKKGPQYSNSFSTRVPVSTAFTPELITLAQGCLARIYKDGYSYKKAGVMLTGIENNNTKQLSLFQPDAKTETRQKALMHALDSVNQKWGRDTIQYAAAGLGRPWKMRQLRKSARFTTCWEEIPHVT